jgi:hypothetical protein
VQADPDALERLLKHLVAATVLTPSFELTDLGESQGQVLDVGRSRRLAGAYYDGPWPSGTGDARTPTATGRRNGAAGTI